MSIIQRDRMSVFLSVRLYSIVLIKFFILGELQFAPEVELSNSNNIWIVSCYFIAPPLNYKPKDAGGAATSN